MQHHIYVKKWKSVCALMFWFHRCSRWSWGRSSCHSHHTLDVCVWCHVISAQDRDLDYPPWDVMYLRKTCIKKKKRRKVCLSQCLYYKFFNTSFFADFSYPQIRKFRPDEVANDKNIEIELIWCLFFDINSFKIPSFIQWPPVLAFAFLSRNNNKDQSVKIKYFTEHADIDRITYILYSAK